MGPILISNTKINSRWIKDFIMKGKALKLLEENIKEYLSDFGRPEWLRSGGRR